MKPNSIIIDYDVTGMLTSLNVGFPYKDLENQRRLNLLEISLNTPESDF